MKTNLRRAALLLCGWLAAGCAPAPEVAESEYLIEGRLRNVPDSTVIRLVKEEGQLLRTIACDTVVGGRFSFRDTVGCGAPRKLLLLADGPGFPGSWLDVWVQQGRYIEITGDDRLLPLWSVRSRVAEQRAANDFKALLRAERRQTMTWNAEQYDLFRAESEQGIDWRRIDSLRRLCRPLDSLIYLAELDHMRRAPVTAVWLDKYRGYCSFLQYKRAFGHRELIRSLHARMSEAHRATEQGLEIEAYLNLPREVGVGDEMADGDLYDLQGNRRRLSEFRGKYILLDFRSQGCAPCVRSLPETEQIAQRYREQLEVVGICQDPEREWKRFAADNGLKGNQWNELRRGNTGLGAAYGVVGIPSYVLIAPDGKVAAMWSGYGEGSIEARIEQLVK